jgi:hypothetical protein
LRVVDSDKKGGQQYVENKTKIIMFGSTKNKALRKICFTCFQRFKTQRGICYLIL